MVILKRPKDVKILREVPDLTRPYVPKDYPNKFYVYDPELSNCVAGYEEGPYNAYADKLMQL